jgi:hypothetical protein
VREGSLELADAARATGASFEVSRRLLVEAPPDLSPHLLGAEPGAVLGPVPGPGGFAVVEVRSRILPALADPDVRRRAEAELIDRVVRRETDARVRWSIEP